MNRGVLYALGAAALFGASTPFAKLLLGEISPWVLAAVLYLGSGVGRANSGTRPELRDTVWVTRGVRDPDIVLAHWAGSFPKWSGAVLILLGAWSIYFGLFVEVPPA